MDQHDDAMSISFGENVTSITSDEVSGRDSQSFSNRSEPEVYRDFNNTRRNEPVTFPKFMIPETITPQGARLRLGETVELEGTQRPEIERDGDFFRVALIIEDATTGYIQLRGWRFRRNSLMVSYTMPTKINEVTMLIEQDSDDDREFLDQGMETISLLTVVKKRKLILTNNAFPTYSFRGHTAFSSNAPDAPTAKRSIRDSSELVCRWISITRFDSSNQRKEFNNKLKRNIDEGKTKVHIEGTLRRIRAAEADANYTVRDSMLMLEWLGHFPWQCDEACCPKASHRAAADICCGAGFASLGLKQAGFKVHWALDMNEDAVATYTLNHSDTTVYCVDVGDFTHFVYYDEHHVEILHCSFPCQWFSPAHTHEGQNDEANTAALFALRELLLRVKPRILTFEQTSGLLTHHPDWLQMVFRTLTDLGYSVGWKMMNLAEHKLAHMRERLIIIASCPGSALPPFPKPTHGPRGTRRYLTIAKALAPLTRASRPITRHNPDRMPRLNLTPYSPRTQLRNTFTTGGTTAHHPSGTRKFSVREAVLLQGGPITMAFPERLSNTEVMRQAGNAFPVAPACAIFASIRGALDVEDGLMAAEQLAAEQ